MKVVIDKDSCVGCGSCEEICPAVFGVVDDIAENRLGEAADILEEYVVACREAADACPVDAITIE
jgi:ferredoxin